MRVVSLVPSLAEAVALTAPGPLVGVTDRCTHSAGLVVLPDEPYRFTPADGPEAFPGLSAVLVDGRHLTWCGPSRAEAAGVLRAAFR